MPPRFRTSLLALVVIFLVALLTGLVMLRSRTLPRPRLPSPNGYDDFVKAGEAVAENVGDFAQLDHDSLRTLVDTNAESLRLLRVGLTRQCAMPVDSALTNLNLDELGNMKRLVRLLAAEGRLREMDNRPADAARSYTDAIRFGNEISRGGFIIHRLVGVACEAIGCHALAQVVPKLSREDSRILLSELEKIDAGRVTWAEVLRSEQYYARYQLRNRSNPIMRVLGWWQARPPIQQAETKQKIIIAHERLLAAELALRCYQSEQGHPPALLQDLVTNYLAKAPQDPFTGQPMTYRLQGTTWLLYSVGPDGVDDGGRPAAKGWPVKGDIRFDSAW
jgi:hypothetical protein